MTARIEIHETISIKSNWEGECVSKRHDHIKCSDFNVVIVNRNKSSLVFSNGQYDSFAGCISGARKKYLSEAKRKAVDLSEILGVPVELEPIPTYARLQELRDIITQAEAELSEIEKGQS